MIFGSSMPGPESRFDYISIDPGPLMARRSTGLWPSLVVPRPIAWVSTINSEGQANLAPFSFFLP